MKNWKTKKLKDLAVAFRSLKTEGELAAFLRDLCTPEELSELSERWEIAQLLDKGESYRAIAAKTKVSTTTITRVSQWLNNGEGGYRTALKRVR